MWLVFLFFIILGIVFSKIEVKIDYFHLSNKIFDYRLKVSLKLFGILKIIEILIQEDGLRFLGFKIKLPKFEINKIDKKIVKNLPKINFEKIDFKLRLGLIDINLTNFVVVGVSSLFSIFINGKIKEKNLKYEILPNYQDLCIYLDGKIILSLKTLDLIKNIKENFEHNKIKDFDVKERLKYE